VSSNSIYSGMGTIYVSVRNTDHGISKINFFLSFLTVSSWLNAWAIKIMLSKCLLWWTTFSKLLLTLQRTNTENSKQIFPEKEIAWPQSQFFTFMCLWSIYIFPRSICLFCTWMWKSGLRPRNSQKRNHKWDFRCSVEKWKNITNFLPAMLFPGWKYKTAHAFRATTNVLTYRS